MMTMTPWPKANLPTEMQATDHNMPPTQGDAHATKLMNDWRTQPDHATLIHNRLLPELMSHIFELCIYSQRERQWEAAIFERREYPKDYFKPLSLSGVCREWRDIACHTHGLWNKIFILPDNSPAIEEERARTWLIRSGNHPLSLYVACKNDFEETPPFTESHSSLIRTINQYSTRWCHLFLHASCKWMSQICASIPKDQPTPFLKTLKLMPTMNASNLSTIFPSKTVLPPSISLFLKNKRDCSLKDLNVDWSNVTHLVLTHVRATECMDVLEKAPQLISLSLEEFNQSSGNYLADGRSLVHRSLQSLKLCSRYSEFNPYIQLLPTLSFPALSQLHCEFMASHMDLMRTLSPLSFFIERSGCSLKTLSLIDISSSDQELIRLLKTTPSLEDLQITQPFWLEAENGKTLGPLWDYIGTSSTFLPHLRSLSYMSRLPDIPWSRFPGIFGDSDKKPRRPLKKLTIVSSNPPPDSDWGYVDSDSGDESLIEEKPDKDLIDRDTVVRFMQLKKAGMTIDIYNAFDRTQDLLKRSMDIHEMEVIPHPSKLSAWNIVVRDGTRELEGLVQQAVVK